MKLDADEKELLDSVEQGEWKSAKGGKRERTRYSRYAKATFRKDRRRLALFLPAPPTSAASLVVCWFDSLGGSVAPPGWVFGPLGGVHPPPFFFFFFFLVFFFFFFVFFVLPVFGALPLI